MIDYRYRIIKQNNRYIIQGQSVHSSDSRWELIHARWSNTYPSVCSVDGDFGELDEAKKLLGALIESSTYEVILEVQAEGKLL